MHIEKTDTIRQVRTVRSDESLAGNAFVQYQEWL